MDFSNLTLVYPFRKDIEYRVENIKISTEYFKKYCPNVEIIVVEYDNKPSLKDKADILSNFDQYHFLHDPHVDNVTFTKSKPLNFGFQISQRSYVAAVDVDSIVENRHIEKAIQILENDTEKNIGMSIPYCGTVVLTTELLKQQFKTTLSQELLNSKIKNKKHRYSDKFVSLAHTCSVGGFCVFRKDDYLTCGGFNTNFKGWGYEDVEILDRFKILGLEVERVEDDDAVLWHLKHGNTLKERQRNYKYNKSLYENIIKKNREQMFEYVGKLIDQL